jgi:hypothetical protein
LDFEHSDLESFSDKIDTVGCLCTEKAVQFFQALGATDYVLGILRDSHHAILTGPVSYYDFRNNGYFYKHIDFAKSELFKLIKSGRIEIVSKQGDHQIPGAKELRRNQFWK